MKVQQVQKRSQKGFGTLLEILTVAIIILGADQRFLVRKRDIFTFWVLKDRKYKNSELF
jgi:hypothetical protein